MNEPWNDRISPETAANIVQLALQDGCLAKSPAVLFHDLKRMRQRIKTLQTAFPPTALHALAIKANPLVEVLRHAVAAGAGLEAATMAEVHLALAAGCTPERIVYDSPAKTQQDIEEALQLGIYLNADNLDELKRMAHILSGNTPKAPIGLRVNPDLPPGSIAMTSVVGRSARFGVPLHVAASQVVEAFSQYPWLVGLHTHVGSQGSSLKLLVDAAKTLAGLRQRIHDAVKRPQIRWLDIGGGLPAAYQASDQLPTPRDYINALQQQVPELFTSDTRLITEFGRSIQAGCGLVVSRVEVVKDTPPTAVIHVGADLFLRRVYQPQVWHHDMTLLDRDGQLKTGPLAPIDIAGPLCFAGDILAKQLSLPPVEPGDWIVIHDTGAYTLSLWSRHCNRAMPKVVGYDADQSDSFCVLREAETPADVVRFWSRDAGMR